LAKKQIFGLENEKKISRIINDDACLLLHLLLTSWTGSFAAICTITNPFYPRWGKKMLTAG
jgi:hypothetical protein